MPLRRQPKDPPNPNSQIIVNPFSYNTGRDGRTPRSTPKKARIVAFRLERVEDSVEVRLTLNCLETNGRTREVVSSVTMAWARTWLGELSAAGSLSMLQARALRQALTKTGVAAWEEHFEV
jgi:hypothetical protein